MTLNILSCCSWSYKLQFECSYDAICWFFMMLYQFLFPLPLIINNRNYNINNYNKHAKIKSPFQNPIHGKPVDGRTMPKRRPADDLPMIVGFIVVRRRLAGGPAVTARAPADRRRDIGRKFCHLLSESGGGRTVTQRRPADVRCLTFTTWFKVEKIRRWSGDAKK